MTLWVARDKSGDIGLYSQKPIWRKATWTSEPFYDWLGEVGDAAFMGYLEKDSFPEVTFENSPMQVELTLLNKNNDE